VTKLDRNRSRLLAGLTLAASEQLGGDAVCVDENNQLRKWRMARVNDVALIDQAADETAPRSINVYLVDAQDIDPVSGLAENGKRFKIGPDRLLYALRWLHKASPPDLDLTLARDPEPWLAYVLTTLLSALQEADPKLRERLAAVATSP
jgi:hypothetical protein